MCIACVTQYLVPSLFSLSHSFLPASSPPFPPITLFIPLNKTIPLYLGAERDSSHGVSHSDGSGCLPEISQREGEFGRE